VRGAPPVFPAPLLLHQLLPTLVRAEVGGKGQRAALAVLVVPGLGTDGQGIAVARDADNLCSQ
jgi:hypothetical protein